MSHSLSEDAKNKHRKIVNVQFYFSSLSFLVFRLPSDSGCYARRQSQPLFSSTLETCTSDLMMQQRPQVDLESWGSIWFLLDCKVHLMIILKGAHLQKLFWCYLVVQYVNNSSVDFTSAKNCITGFFIVVGSLFFFLCIYLCNYLSILSGTYLFFYHFLK